MNGSQVGWARRLGIAAVAATVLGLVSFCAPGSAAAATVAGTLTLTPGSCSGGTATGTYLRMILPSGSPSGPFMSNSDSTCSDQSITPLAPGSDGGLIAGSYQPIPSPPFDSHGNALARRITAPAQFYGTSFATATNAVDPQTHIAVPAPRVTISGTTLSADLRAWSVTWNNQYFNQGAPKPDGSLPGNTRVPTGTYNPSTGAFTLQWTSQVVGGPFDKFTGLWHLQGRITTSSTSSAGTGGNHAGTTSTGGSGTTGAPAATGAALGGAASTSTAGAAADGTHTSSRASVAPVAANATGSGGGQVLAASTTTVTRETWHVQWWLVALAVAIAIGGFGALFVLNRLAGKAKATP